LTGREQYSGAYKCPRKLTGARHCATFHFGKSFVLRIILNSTPTQRHQTSLHSTIIMRAFLLKSIVLGSATYAFAQGAQPCYNAAAPNQYVEVLLTYNMKFLTHTATSGVLATTVDVTMVHAGRLIRSQKSLVSRLLTNKSARVQHLPTNSQNSFYLCSQMRYEGDYSGCS
jgi:hypothetical protein